MRSMVEGARHVRCTQPQSPSTTPSAHGLLRKPASRLRHAPGMSLTAAAPPSPFRGGFLDV